MTSELRLLFKRTHFFISRRISRLLSVGFLIISCGESPMVEFTLQNPKQDADFETVTVTVLAKETTQSCDVIELTVLLNTVLGNGNKLETTVELGEILKENKGELVSKEVSISTGGIVASSVETSDGTFIASNCGKTGYGF